MPKRGPVGELADRIRKDSPVPIFPVFGSPPDDQIRFGRDDVGSFLDLAKQSGARLLYLVEGTVDEDEENSELAKHEGETSFVEAWFMVEGVAHVFATVAEWAEDENEKEGATAGPADGPARASEALRTDPDSIEKEFLELRSKGSWPHEPVEGEVRFALRLFVYQKFRLPDPRYRSLDEPNQVDPLIALLAAKVSSALLQEDQERADGLLPDVVEWARANGVSRLARTDLDAYMLEKKVSLWPTAKRQLWTKAKFQLKTGK